MHDTLPLLGQSDFPALTRRGVEVLQINVGLRCNQQCVHCHVNASPKRREAMSDETITAVCDYLESGAAHTLDITGGAPELHPRFRDLVIAARGLDMTVIDRCNLTILNELGHEDLADFLARHEVDVVASLPCYLEENVDRQRGRGVFASSLEGLRKLNRLGYGRRDSGLRLNLVYNPQGAVLPPSQEQLEADYKRILKREYGIEFDQLFVLCNMPIKRFGSMLISKGAFHDYIALLKRSHDDDNLDQVMCRNLISVDWRGFLYDCDFNQMLGLPLAHAGGRLQISELRKHSLADNAIVVRDHCYGCTAGQGSSCGGALSG